MKTRKPIRWRVVLIVAAVLGCLAVLAIRWGVATIDDAREWQRDLEAIGNR